MLWLNEPPVWAERDGILSVSTGEKTDFWRETHYGFIRDSGHFRYQKVEGDFVAEVAFHGRYEHLYDQAGLMVRLDDRNWIKTGIEFVDGRQMLSVVVTRDFSDWSTMPLPLDANWLRIKLLRQGSTVHVGWTTPDAPAKQDQLRLAYLPSRALAQVGPMCCSPERAGFEVEFRDFAVSAFRSDSLHG